MSYGIRHKLTCLLKLVMKPPSMFPKFKSIIRINEMCASGIVTFICVLYVVSALPVTWPPFQCFADVCNVNGQQEFCDKAESVRLCRQCSDVRQDCFTAKQEANCSEYCYDYRYQQDLEIQRLKGCSLPSPPENVRFHMNKTHLPYNVTMEMTCLEGFRLIGNPVVRCGNFSVLEWSPPQCEVITCTRLRPTPHGKWIIPVSQLLPGTNAWLVCQTGYHVNGDAKVTCTSSGEWESKDKNLRVCLPDITTSVIACPPLRPTPHGKWIIPDAQLLPGTNAWLVCQAGYQVDGDAKVTCTSSGEWESNDKFLRVCLPDITPSGDRKSLVIVIVVLALSFCGIFALAYRLTRLKRTNTRVTSRMPNTHTAEDPAEEQQLVPQVCNQIMEDNTRHIETTNANSATSGNQDSPRPLPI